MLSLTTMRLARLLTGGLLAFSLSLPVSSDQTTIYKWIDADGITHYSQQPPSGDTQVTEIKAQLHSSETAAAAQSALQNRVDGLNERREDKKLAAEEGEAAVAKKKQRDTYCEGVKRRLADFQTGRRLAEQQEDGSYAPVTDERRAEQIADMQAKINEHCS